MSKKLKEEKQYIDFKYNFSVFWKLVSKYKGIIAGLLVLILLFQVSYSVESFLFKILIDNGTSYVSSDITKDAFISVLMILFAVFASLTIVKSVMRWFYLHMINLFEARVMLDLKRMMFDHLIKLSYEFHSSNRTGSIISRLVRGSGAVERLSDVFLFNFIPLLFQTLVVGGTILIFHPASALTVIVVIAVFITYSFYINKKQQSANLAFNDAEDYEKAVISDVFTNIESIKYFGKEERVKKKYLDIGTNTKNALIRHWNYYRSLSAGHSLIMGIGVLLIVMFPILGVIEGTITMGTVVFIYTSFGSMMGHLYGFDHGLRGYYRGMADLESLFKYRRVENEIKDRHDSKNLRIIRGEIEFKNVSFRYKNKYVLKNFNLSIPPKKKVALVGPSGSGKTTIVKLLYRLYDLENGNGNILIDGKDISSVKQESLRSELSIVPQECILFDDTVENNISFSSHNSSKEKVKKAMKFAQLDKVVANFHHKEKTIVGERGVKLSGGEKQRVSIARAILANKKVLVLDEATSALDSATEYEIQSDLEKLMQGRTSLVIAHRLSTIMSADIIVVMDKGKIVQTGTHSQLIKKDGLYKKLWNLQKGGYIG